MNIKRLVLAILAGWVVIFATGFLIHHFWLGRITKRPKSIWRPEDEMQTRIHWMFIAQFLGVATFVIVWAKGFAGRSVGTGVVFGLLMGLFQAIWVLVQLRADSDAGRSRGEMVLSAASPRPCSWNRYVARLQAGAGRSFPVAQVPNLLYRWLPAGCALKIATPAMNSAIRAESGSTRLPSRCHGHSVATALAVRDKRCHAMVRQRPAEAVATESATTRIKKRRRPFDRRRLFLLSKPKLLFLGVVHFLHRLVHVFVRLFHRIEFFLLLRGEQRTDLRAGALQDRLHLFHRFLMDGCDLRLRLIDDRLHPAPFASAVRFRLSLKCSSGFPIMRWCFGPGPCSSCVPFA